MAYLSIFPGNAKVIHGIVHMTMTNPDEVFEDIYNSEIWTSGSGSGSSAENTAAYRTFLQAYLVSNHITSVLDLGCGDWQSSRLIDWTGVDYCGVDVVGGLVERNNCKYGSDHIRFERKDIVNDSLPLADLLIIKDVFQHWPNQTIQDFRERALGYGHVLITNTVAMHHAGSSKLYESDAGLNQDIMMGAMRPVDLALPPFNWLVEEHFRHYSYRPRVDVMETKTTVAPMGSLPGTS